MRLTRTRIAAPEADQGVTTLELFFDLVFVYTITQVTSVLRAGGEGYPRALVILLVTWWMYDGYCWLANNIGPTTLETRLPMLVAMAGFLIMAIATPDAFQSGAWPFACAYAVVVMIHGLQFGRSSLGGSAQAIWAVLRLNLGIAGGLVVAAVLAPHGGAWIGWAIGAAIIVLLVARGAADGFTLRADHFAERHSALIIIALGETVVATGAGAQGRLDHPSEVVATLLSLTLLAALWWVYFGGDDTRAAEELAASDPSRMADHALWAYGIVHFLHIVGLILVAAGLHFVVAEPTHALSARACIDLGAGAAVFLLAQVWFRLRMRLGPVAALVLGAVGCLVVQWVGHTIDGLVELAGLGAVVVLALVGSARTTSPAGSAPPAGSASPAGSPMSA